MEDVEQEEEMEKEDEVEMEEKGKKIDDGGAIGLELLLTPGSHGRDGDG